MGNYGELWGSMGDYRELWGLMGFYGVLWGIMGSYGELWGFMGFHGVLWGVMGNCGELWGIMGFFGVVWGSMGMGFWDAHASQWPAGTICSAAVQDTHPPPQRPPAPARSISVLLTHLMSCFFMTLAR